MSDVGGAEAAVGGEIADSDYDSALALAFLTIICPPILAPSGVYEISL